MGWSDYIKSETNTALTTKFKMQKSLLFAYYERIICVQFFAWRQNYYYPTISGTVFVTYKGKYYKSIPQETYPPYNYNQQPDIHPEFWEQSTYEDLLFRLMSSQNYARNNILKPEINGVYFMQYFDNMLDNLIAAFGYIGSGNYIPWTIESIYASIQETRIDSRTEVLPPEYYRKWYQQVIKILNLLDTRKIILANNFNSEYAPALCGQMKFAGNIPLAGLAQYSKNNNGVLETIDVPGGTTVPGTNALFDSSAEYAPVTALSDYGWSYGKYMQRELELGFEHYRINYDYNSARFTNVLATSVQSVYVKQQKQHYIDHVLQPNDTIYETKGVDEIVDINAVIDIPFNTALPEKCPEIYPPEAEYFWKNNIYRYSNNEMYLKFKFNFIAGS